jgi:1-acyl-sn-glycerol-3-phosphate acyltransferase
MRPWYRIVWTVSRSYYTLFHGLSFHGVEHVPAGGCIIAPNHVSFLDPPLVGCCVDRELYYLARKTLFKPPVMDKLLPSINSIPVDQERPDMVGLKRIIQIIRDGGGVILFPEGSRSPDGKLQAGQPGIGLTVAKAGAPVVPVRIFGAFEAWPIHGKLKLFRPVQVVFGRPLFFDPKEYGHRDRYQDIADRIMQAIAEIQPV